MPVHHNVTNLFGCDNEYKAVAAGAAAAITGLDRLFVGFGAPSALHWGLAGAGIDAYCKGKIPEFNTRLAMCVAGGYVGGLAVNVARGQGVPFTGPLIVL